MTKQRLLKFLIILLISLGLSGLIAFYQIKSDDIGSGVVAKNFGGPFTLTDHTGKTVTDQNFNGQYRLIYFGFTYCPAICPTELQRISTVLKELGDKGKQIQPIFVTVDPERDTAEIMKNYVSMFHPRLVGLTGTPEQIKQITSGYKIYYAKVQDDSMSDYTMDHSSFIYFMGPDDSLLRIFKMSDSIEDIVKVIDQKL